VVEVRGVRGHLEVGAKGAIALVLAAVLSSTGVVAAQSRPQSASKPTLEQDLAAITEFNRRYLKAINDGDIATLSSLTDDDHIMITPGRAPTIGKAAKKVKATNIRVGNSNPTKDNGQLTATKIGPNSGRLVNC